MVCFDVQTTGVDIESDRIVTAAVCRVGKDTRTTERVWHLNPEVEMTEEAVRIHGITPEMAATYQDSREGVGQIIECLEEELDGCPLIVFNARFDLTILDREAERNGIKPLTDRLDFTVIDPLVIDRAMDKFRPGKRTLKAVAEHYRASANISGASEGALAAGRVAWRLGEKFELLKTSAEVLHRSEITWAGEQADSLQDYFDRSDIDRTIARGWPTVPAPAFV